MRRQGLQARQGVRRGSLRVQPDPLILRRQDDGHAVVELGYQAIGGGGEHGEGVVVQTWREMVITP